MRFSPFLFLSGQIKLKIDSKDSAKVLNLFMKYSIPYRDFYETDEGKTEFVCTPYSAQKAIIVCKKNNIKIEKTQSKGLPHLIYKYRKRVGLFAGLILALLIVCISDNYLWSINVSGNSKVMTSEIVDALKENGIYVGRKIKDIDVDKAETLTLMNSKNISWMTVNLKGTCANVQVREAVKKPEDKPKKPANIVAKMDGQIEFMEVYSGYAHVKAGSAVREGDLLISGIGESDNIGYTVTRANGKVFAETSHNFRIEVPLEYEVKRAVCEKNVEKSLIFFSKEIKILKRCGNSAYVCDTIENVEMFGFLNGAVLPFGIRNVKEIYYEKDVLKLTDKRAADIAYYRLEKEIKNKLPDAILLSKQTDFEILEDKYVLNCKISCIEDIAKVLEFDYNSEK